MNPSIDAVAEASRLWLEAQTKLRAAEHRLADECTKIGSDTGVALDVLRGEVFVLRTQTDDLFAAMTQALAEQRKGFRTGG